MRTVFILLSLVALCAFVPELAKDGSPWRSADYIQARLVAGGPHPDHQDFTIAGGLEVRLEDGWHAYWRTPGDAGLAPTFDWSRSFNIVASPELHWPVPKRFEEMGIYVNGYENHILFPLAFRIEDKAKPSTLAVKMDMMVCEKICVPQSVFVTLDIPPDYDSPGAGFASVLAKAREELPVKGDTPALRIDSVVAGPDALVINAWSQRGYMKADVFVENTGDIVISRPPHIAPDKKEERSAMIRIPRPEGISNLARALSGKTIRIILTDGERAIEKEVTL